jgi:hypothetical protein
MTDKLAEGKRPWTAVAGAGVPAAETNDFYNELARMLGPRDVNVLFEFQNISGFNYWEIQETEGAFLTTNDDLAEVIFPITLPVGCKITEISVEVSGNNNILAGLIEYNYGDNGEAINTVDLTSGVGLPWQTGGVNYEDRVEYKVETSPLPLIVDPDWYSYVKITAGSNVSTPYVSKIWQVKATYQYYY